MKKQREPSIHNRIYQYITDRINAYLIKYRLPAELNNDLVKLRNDFSNFIKWVLAEQRTKERYGVDIDYINSNINRINLSEADNPYLLKGAINKARPPGPTNDEIEALLRIVRSKINELTDTDFVKRIAVTDDIVNEIKRTFAIPNENIPFTTQFYDRSPNAYPQFSQNIPCEACSENRAVDACHIIPAAFGGSNVASNIIYLCPTHHRLFDKCMLTEQEWNSIDFSTKGRISSNYAFYVLPPKMKKFWENLESGTYKKTTVYDTALSENDRILLQDSILQEMLALIRANPGITLEQLHEESTLEKKIIKQAIIELKKSERIQEKRQGYKRIYFVPI